MKKIIIALIMIAATTVTAQNYKTKTTSAGPSQIQQFSEIPENEITGLMTFTNGAANIGVDYARMTDDMGYGGYFLLQTEKKPAVTQVMSFGGLMKFKIADKNKFSASLLPGFGIHMFKDIGASDETALGLVLKIAAQYKFTSEFAMGIESTTLTNMFSDKAPSQAEILSIAGTVAF